MHRSSRQPQARTPGGFTLIEVLVVVAIIVVLIAILVPALGAFRRHAVKAAATAHMGAIRAGLQQYFADHQMYPPSTSSAAYGGMGLGRGAAMLAQGLMGYLPANVDGAGPGAGDPAFGFRTRKSQMGGRIYGPYAPSDPKGYRRITPGILEVFIDPWGNEILYFRSTRIDPTATLPAPEYIFGTAALQNGYFIDNDCDRTPVPQGSPSANPNQAGTSGNPGRPAFFKLLSSHPQPNIIGSERVPGASSFLIISAGDDGKYFTGDDIVMSN